MPRTSSFSVRDILDLPQMKTSAEGSVTNGAVDSDAISHATDLYAAASAQRLQGIFIHDDNSITDIFARISFGNHNQNVFLYILGVATTLADFAAARGRDYNTAANYSGHYQGFLDASRASQHLGWPPIPPSLQSMQGNTIFIWSFTRI